MLIIFLKNLCGITSGLSKPCKGSCSTSYVLEWVLLLLGFMAEGPRGVVAIVELCNSNGIDQLSIFRYAHGCCVQIIIGVSSLLSTCRLTSPVPLHSRHLC